MIFFFGNQGLLVAGFSNYDGRNPLPEFLEFKNDSLFVTNLKNEHTIKTKARYEQIINGDTLPFYFAEIDMDFNLKFQKRNNKGVLKVFNKNRPGRAEYHFHKPIKTPKWSLNKVLKTLTKGTFTTNINKTKSPNSDLEIKKHCVLPRIALPPIMLIITRMSCFIKNNTPKVFL